MFSVGYVSQRVLEVLTAVLLKIQVFWDVTLCPWLSSSRSFEGLHLQGEVQIFLDCFALKVEALRALNVGF
jgi:hypothetical protein